MSSIFVDTSPLGIESGLRLRSAAETPCDRSRQGGTVPTATLSSSSSNWLRPAKEEPAAPIIVVLVSSPGGRDADVIEAFERRSSGIPTADGVLRFSRAVPERVLPTLREVQSFVRNKIGGGSFVAFTLEPQRANDPGGVHPAVEAHDDDLRNRESLEFQEISIDPARREVWVEGSLIGLTKSEFDLLYVLAQRRGVVFSRRQIVLAYKGADYPVDDRSIDVQMFNLRRKIRGAGSALQTIRGVGYRFTGTPLV